MDRLRNLLVEARNGNGDARAQLFAVAYDELRSHARAQLRNGGRSTLLNTTVLVHESYLRFLQAGHLAGVERGQFFSYAAQVMRSVVVDFARHRRAQRRGGDAPHIPLNPELAEQVSAFDDQVVKMDEALEALKGVDERLVHVVEMRYFAGMTEAEVASALGVTERTVRRDWQKARLLLAAALR
jgi:RNA polymerase sigma factor (TIGR02999 family)